jgi:hypothetical protein
MENKNCVLLLSYNNTLMFERIVKWNDAFQKGNYLYLELTENDLEHIYERLDEFHANLFRAYKDVCRMSFDLEIVKISSILSANANEVMEVSVDCEFILKRE